MILVPYLIVTYNFSGVHFKIAEGIYKLFNK
jgi:hypothetical protein